MKIKPYFLTASALVLLASCQQVQPTVEEKETAVIPLSKEAIKAKVEEALSASDLQLTDDKFVTVQSDENHLIYIDGDEFVYIDLTQDTPKIYRLQPKNLFEVVEVLEDGYVVKHEDHFDYIKTEGKPTVKVGDRVSLDNVHYEDESTKTENTQTTQPAATETKETGALSHDDDGYVFDPKDIVKETEVGYVVRHNDHYHFIFKTPKPATPVAKKPVTTPKQPKEEAPASGEHTHHPSKPESDDVTVVIKHPESKSLTDQKIAYIARHLKVPVESIQIIGDYLVYPHGDHYHTIPLSDIDINGDPSKLMHLDHDEHDHGHNHSDENDHHHSHEINPEDIQDRPLSDFSGSFASLTKYIEDGSLDNIFAKLGEEHNETVEEVRANFLESFKTPYKSLNITDEGIQLNEQTVNYTYDGYETLKDENGKIYSVWYFFKSETSPKYIGFDDHAIAPGASHHGLVHLHVVFLEDKSELQEMEATPFYIDARATSEEVIGMLLGGHSHEDDHDDEHHHDHSEDDHHHDHTDISTVQEKVAYIALFYDINQSDITVSDTSLEFTYKGNTLRLPLGQIQVPEMSDDLESDFIKELEKLAQSWHIDPDKIQVVDGFMKVPHGDHTHDYKIKSPGWHAYLENKIPNISSDYVAGSLDRDVVYEYAQQLIQKAESVYQNNNRQLERIKRVINTFLADLSWGTNSTEGYLNGLKAFEQQYLTTEKENEEETSKETTPVHSYNELLEMTNALIAKNKSSSSNYYQISGKLNQLKNDIVYRSNTEESLSKSYYDLLKQYPELTAVEEEKELYTHEQLSQYVKQLKEAISFFDQNGAIMKQDLDTLQSNIAYKTKSLEALNEELQAIIAKYPKFQNTPLKENVFDVKYREVRAVIVELDENQYLSLKIQLLNELDAIEKNEDNMPQLEALLEKAKSAQIVEKNNNDLIEYLKLNKDDVRLTVETIEKITAVLVKENPERSELEAVKESIKVDYQQYEQKETRYARLATNLLTELDNYTDTSITQEKEQLKQRLNSSESKEVVYRALVDLLKRAKESTTAPETSQPTEETSESEPVSEESIETEEEVQANETTEEALEDASSDSVQPENTEAND